MFVNKHTFITGVQDIHNAIERGNTDIKVIREILARVLDNTDDAAEPHTSKAGAPSPADFLTAKASADALTVGEPSIKGSHLQIPVTFMLRIPLLDSTKDDSNG